MGEVSSIVSLTKQQIAVYKMAQKPTPQNKVLENVRLEVVEQEKGINKLGKIKPIGYKSYPVETNFPIWEKLNDHKGDVKK